MPLEQLYRCFRFLTAQMSRPIFHEINLICSAHFIISIVMVFTQQFGLDISTHYNNSHVKFEQVSVCLKFSLMSSKL